MGGAFSWMGAWWPFGGLGEAKLLITGLDAAGKTTMLYRMKLGAIVTTIPTIGFNVETIQVGDLTITSWDMGGRDKMRPLWRLYIQDLEALIYVVDSHARDRMPEARAEVHERLSEPLIAKAPMMIIANKQDMKGAMNVAEMRVALGVEDVRGRFFCIHPASALTGEGLKEAFEWLSDAIRRTRNGEVPTTSAPAVATAPAPASPAAATPVPPTPTAPPNSLPEAAAAFTAVAR